MKETPMKGKIASGGRRAFIVQVGKEGGYKASDFKEVIKVVWRLFQSGLRRGVLCLLEMDLP